MKKLYNFVVSMKLMSACTVLFAIAIGAATFIENDYGTPAAQALIYKTHWFELLLLVLVINLIGNIFRMNLIQKDKTGSLIFHLSFILIILGAGITRYISYEGIMHIRENGTSDFISSSESFISITAEKHDIKQESHKEVIFSGITNANYEKELNIDDKEIKIELISYIPDAKERVVNSENGKAILSAVVAGNKGRKNLFLKDKESVNIKGLDFNFNNSDKKNDINISYTNNELLFIAPFEVSGMRMSDQKKEFLKANEPHPLLLKTLYDFNGVNIVFSDFKSQAIIEYSKGNLKPKDELQDLVLFNISTEKETKKNIAVWGNKGRIGIPSVENINGVKLSIAYGSKPITLPFSIKLNDFQLERYPGSNSPSSFASEITLVDNGLEENHRIFMNNVLNYKGYRFFQSSYDQDELGSYLSVNHDFWGTIVTYLGYSLLGLGMLITLFSKKSRFLYLSQRLSSLNAKKVSSATMVILLLLLFVPFASNSQTLPDSIKVINYDHARKFGKVLVQDREGRIKPVNTLSSEIVRKVSGKSELFGLHPDQVILSMMLHPGVWQDLPIIKVKHPELQSILGITGKTAAFSDIFNRSGYKLSKQVEKANNTSPGQRSKLDKEIIKVDERFNICYMIFVNELLTVFPKPKDPNQKWYSAATGAKADFIEGGVFVKNFFGLYLTAIKDAQETGNWKIADETLGYLNSFQEKFGSEIIPVESKINMEILYNDIQIFKKLSKYYGLVGILMLVVFLIKIFNPLKSFKLLIIPGKFILTMLFLAHTSGLAIRWYISGHAPWSNGYESMIYIGWATMLAGFLFSKRSDITLSITAVLSSLILWVAGLNWLDPEITNLVPVLNSYWLMIHVSMITASYGFLALGFLLAFFNMILMIATTKRNANQIKITLEELSIIIEMALTAGLFLLTIGTFLGGVWANESWGRYWGWDAKETWALVTIMVYSFILHLRFIPALSSRYIFNLTSMFGFASVVMTYFGVNYYLSGLHSYAAGDPIPIPDFVYYTVLSLLLVSILAILNEEKLEKTGKKSIEKKMQSKEEVLEV